ncbi:MAG: OmpA family protein [Thermodesulfobacteriota bacterium]
MPRRTSPDRSEQYKLNPWAGFADVMTGLLLMFVFVITLFTLTETILSRTLEKKDTELDRLQRQVTLKTDEIEKLKHEIERLQEMFGAQEKKTVSLEEVLKALQDQLDAALSQIAEKSLLAEEKERTIASLREDVAALRADVQKQAADVKERELSLEQQRAEMLALLSQLREKSTILQEKEKSLADIRLKLDESGRKLAESEGEVGKKSDTITELRSKIDTLNNVIAQLNKRISEYVEQVSKLNRVLAEAKQSEQAESTKAADLQKEILSLRSKLDDISKRLADTREAKAEQFRVSQLVGLLGEKEKEIDRLRKLAKYRSEFLAKLEQVFAGVPDIKVQGDRFVFQSEILFASGRAEINEGGKKELDKFVKIYKEMVPKIPKDIELVILIQGHTDDVPIRSGRYRSNWELASGRAMEVVRYLIEKGIPPGRVGAASFGEFHPVDVKITDEARRLNRRIEIKITML